jgi:hypothetical protein
LSGAQLKSSEFAYLLAVLNASTVIGLEDPLLFPTKSSDQDATYSEGRQELEANSWMKPVRDYPDEYELNPILLEMVSIITAPEFVVDTSRSTGESEFQQVLHYLANDSIIEVSAPAEKTYQIGAVPDHESFHARIAEMLGIAASKQANQLTVNETVFKDLQSLAKKGQPERAQTLLDSSTLKKKSVQSLISSLASQSSGQIVVVSADTGQVMNGRRALVFGEGDSAWLAKRKEHDSLQFDILSCDATGIGTLITDWMNELTD